MKTLSICATHLGALCLTPLALLACNSSGDDNGGGGGPPLDTAAVAALRMVIQDEAITPLPPAPSYDSALVALGHALFFDKILSGSSDVSCATCHFPTEATGDGRTLPGGVRGTGIGTARFGGDVVPRHSPHALNAHLAGDLFWDGRVDRGPADSLDTPAGAAITPAIAAAFDPALVSLAAQAMLPPTSRSEMRGHLGDSSSADLEDDDFEGIWNALVTRVTDIPEYATMLGAAYPGTTILDWNVGHVGNAIAAFEATAFARFDSPWQRFLEGEDAAMTNGQLHGALEFFGAGGCGRCHSGGSLSDQLYHNVGLPQFGPGKGDGMDMDEDFGRERVTGEASDRFRFRTPTLLNVVLTAPYGHLGQYADLQGIVSHYNDTPLKLMNYDISSQVDDAALIPTLVDNQAEILANLDVGLSSPSPAFDVSSVIDFLGALTDPSAVDLTDLIPATVPSGHPVDVP